MVIGEGSLNGSVIGDNKLQTKKKNENENIIKFLEKHTRISDIIFSHKSRIFVYLNKNWIVKLQKKNFNNRNTK